MNAGSVQRRWGRAIRAALPWLLALALVSPPPLGLLVGATQGLRARANGSSLDPTIAGAHMWGFCGLDPVSRAYLECHYDPRVGGVRALYDRARRAGYNGSLRLLTLAFGPAEGSYLGDLPTEDVVRVALRTQGSSALQRDGPLRLPDGSWLLLASPPEPGPQGPVQVVCGPRLGEGCAEADWVALGVPEWDITVVERQGGRPLQALWWTPSPLGVLGARPAPPADGGQRD